MSTKFYHDIELLIRFSEISTESSKLVLEARKYLKKSVNNALNEIKKLIEINNNIDKLIENGDFLLNDEYPKMCHESNKLYNEIHEMIVVKKYAFLISLLNSVDHELCAIIDEFLYLMYLNENHIKPRKNMSFGWVYSK